MDIDVHKWMRREHPEYECVEAGDPYVTVISGYDEALSEYWADCVENDRQPDPTVVARLTSGLGVYELLVLAHWWQLPTAQPP